MSRERLTIGTFGEIGHLESPNGRVIARARYGDWDGKTRLVQATGDTRKSAERVLKAKLADRSLFQPSSTPDSTFPGLVAYWLEDLELEDRLSKRALQLYERNMKTLVMPAFGNLTLREIGVARCDHFLKQLAKQSYNRAIAVARKERGIVPGPLSAATAAVAIQIAAMRAGSLILQVIADDLNSAGIASPKGGRWYSTSVRRAG